MAHFEDLSPCDYFGECSSSVLRAIGWLEREYPFTVGRIDEAVFRKLESLLADPWQPCAAAGLHDCDLCLFEPERMGTKNLFVPGDHVIFVCPELLIHYINAHGYQPPDVFCQAVLECPVMRSIEYHKKLLASGGRILLQPQEGRVQL